MRITPVPEQMRSAFEALRDPPAFSQSVAVVARGGLPVQMLQAMSLRPELLRAFGAMSEAIDPGGIVEREIKELIIVDVSRRNRCQFCEASHMAMCREIGLGDVALRLDDPRRLTPRQRAAVEWARAITADANRVPPPVVAALRTHFREPEIVEVTALTGLITMLNMFNNALEVRDEDDDRR